MARHTAVAISAAEEPLGELRVRACAAQAERLLAWAAAWPQRTWDRDLGRIMTRERREQLLATARGPGPRRP